MLLIALDSGLRRNDGAGLGQRLHKQAPSGPRLLKTRRDVAACSGLAVLHAA